MKKLSFVIALLLFAIQLLGQEEECSDIDMYDSYSPESNTYEPIPFIKYEAKNLHEKLPKEENTNNDYRIKIGDAFRISIYGEEPASKDTVTPPTTKDVVVSPSGFITYLFPEPIQAMGKTICELRIEIQNQLKSYYRNPYIYITPLSFAGEYYTINGEVNQPGTRLIEGNPTLLSALCDARGFTMNTFRDHYIDFSDLKYSFISRNGEYLPVDFERLIVDGDTTQDVLLRAGDYIFINHRRVFKIYVFGEVLAQQTYQFVTTVTLAEVIAESGGLTNRASSRVFVIRGSLACPKQYYIDINLILKGCAPDFELQPGDIVYVPPRNFTFLREALQDAMRYFVGTAASDAGNQAYIQITPAAAGINGTVSTVSYGTGTTGTATTAGTATGGL